MNIEEEKKLKETIKDLFLYFNFEADLEGNDIMYIFNTIYGLIAKASLSDIRKVVEDLLNRDD